MFAFGDKDWPGLAKLNEEAGELQIELGRLQQSIGRLMQTHGDPKHWKGDLKKQIREECADVEAALIFFTKTNFNKRDKKAFARRVNLKLKRFKLWHKSGEKPKKGKTNATPKPGKDLPRLQRRRK